MRKGGGHAPWQPEELMEDFVSHVRGWAIEKHGTQTYGKYRGEHPEFRKAVYRPDLCEPVWAENEHSHRQCPLPATVANVLALDDVFVVMTEY